MFTFSGTCLGREPLGDVEELGDGLPWAGQTARSSMMQIYANAVANHKATCAFTVLQRLGRNYCELTLGASIPEVINYNEICRILSHVCPEPFSQHWLQQWQITAGHEERQ